MSTEESGPVTKGFLSALIYPESNSTAPPRLQGSHSKLCQMERHKAQMGPPTLQACAKEMYIPC